MDKEDYPKALDYYFKALKLAESLKDKVNTGNLFGNIGVVYNHQGDLDKTLEYYSKALKTAVEIKNKNSEAIWRGNIGQLYTTMKRYKEAELFLLEALKTDKELGAQEHEERVEMYLSILYEKTGKEKLALQHYKRSKELKDELFSEENNKKMIEKEMNFEFEKKQALAKAEADKEAALADKEKQKQRIIIYSVSGILLLVIIFSLFLFNRFHLIQKQKKIIENQKTQVDKAYESLHEKNKEIMDSINYASRIQKALLTSDKYFSRQLGRLMKD